jgi:hypothetical protein
MPPNKIAQLIQTAFHLVDFHPKPFKYLFGFVVKKIDQNVVFIFEIQVNRAIGHAGFLGDLGDGGLVKPLPGKNLHRRFQDQVVLVIFMLFIDFNPLFGWAILPNYE